jgi:hypothetical protein
MSKFIQSLLICCVNPSTQDIGQLPFNCRDVLENNPGLGEVFKVIKQVEDSFFF